MIDGMDEIGLLQGISELEAIICRHPQVQGLIAGHMHRHIQTRFGHARAMVAPSTAHTGVAGMAETVLDGLAGRGVRAAVSMLDTPPRRLPPTD